MSWQSYVDQQLLQTGHVTQAAICGIAGGVWAASPGFAPSQEEIMALVTGFNDSAALLASGIHISGQKYMTLRADDRSIYGKKGAGGVVCVKTNQAILMGVYDDKIQPGQCAVAVEKLADYLLNMNY